MSVLTEINRIKSAVTDILNAIKAKGVTVPTTAKINNLAAYISNIPTGASVATCTINVTFKTNAGNTLTSATTFANGVFSAFKSTTKSGTFTIQNVVCGSALSIGTTYMCSLYWSGSKQDHMSLLGGMITVPSASGTYTVEVGVVDD